MFFKLPLVCSALYSISNGAFFTSVAEAEFEATQFVLTYGYPITVFSDYVAPILISTGVNRFAYQREPASAGSSSDEVYPDADTLTSKVVVDLSEKNVELTVPDVPDGQFYVFSFYDLFGSNFANIGSVTGNHPGKYLLQSGLDVNQSIGYHVTNGSTKGYYQGYVNFPGRYGTLLQRLVLPVDKSNLLPIHKLQNASLVQSIGRPRSHGPQAPALTLALLNDSSTASITLDDDMEYRLRVIARLTHFNPPEEVVDQANVARILEMAGIENGSYTRPAGVNLTIAAFGLRETPQTNTSFYLENNGWTQADPAVQGDYHGDYLQRSTVAFADYLQMVPEEALYPTPEAGSNLVVGENASSVGSASLPIGANESLVLTFIGGKPPVNGYWSVTAYDSNGHLIENPLNRVSLGSRDNITYPSGEPVYSGSNKELVFQLLVQPADVLPPGNWTNNWLPSPSGASNTTLNLRFYAPQGTLLDQSYKFPIITTQAAFRK